MERVSVIADELELMILSVRPLTIFKKYYFYKLLKKKTLIANKFMNNYVFPEELLPRRHFLFVLVLVCSKILSPLPCISTEVKVLLCRARVKSIFHFRKVLMMQVLIHLARGRTVECGAVD